MRIVENPSLAASSPLIRVAETPSVIIGSADDLPDQHLYRVTDATRLPDGGLAVLNAGAGQLQLYDSDGGHYRTVGNRGEGPGEFRAPSWLVVQQDTLMVFDPLQDGGRLSFFTFAGEFLGSEQIDVTGIPFPSPDYLIAGMEYLDVDRLGGGSIGPQEEGHVQYKRHVLKYSRRSPTVDTLVKDLSGEEMYRERDAIGFSQSVVPFGKVPRTAVGGGRFYVGDGSAPVIDAYDLDGNHLMSIRFNAERLPVGDPEVERWIEAKLSDPLYEQRSNLAREHRRRFLRAPVPGAMPAYAGMLVDDEGRLWLHRYVPPWTESNEWWLFDRDGFFLTTVHLPPGLEPFEIGPDYLLGLRRDAMDVEHVELYELH